MSSGYLYALANQSMPGIIKIGCTSRDPFERAKELRSTGVPTSFQVLIAVFTNDMKGSEAAIHTILESRGRRVDNGREFFAVELGELMSLLPQVLDDNTRSEYSENTEPTHPVLLDQAKRYHYGDRLSPPDFKKALKLYRESARQGSIEACTILMEAYKNGIGVKKSEENFQYYFSRINEIKQDAEKERIERIRSITTNPEVVRLLTNKYYSSAITNCLPRFEVNVLKFIVSENINTVSEVISRSLETIYSNKVVTVNDKKNKEIINRRQTLETWIVQLMVETIENNYSLFIYLDKAYNSCIYQKNGSKKSNFYINKFLYYLSIFDIINDRNSYHLNLAALRIMSEEEILKLGTDGTKKIYDVILKA